MVKGIFILAFFCSVAYGQSRITSRSYPVSDSFVVATDSMRRVFEDEGPADTTHSPIFATTYYGTFTGSQFNVTVELHFEINRREMIKIDITDAAGRTVFVSTGRIFEKGLNYAQFDLKIVPNGALYARLSTASGEVRTVKLQQI